MKPVVLIIDAGLGNIGSVLAALRRQECDYIRLKSPPSKEVTTKITHTILPGVGTFKAGMKALTNTHWVEWIKEEYCSRDKPILGICLGMQLMASYGTEGVISEKTIEGLNLIPGKVVKINTKKKLKLPHVGWNTVEWVNSKNFLAEGINNQSDFYFVHSYQFKTVNRKHIIACTGYGSEIVAVAQKNNCYGVQFHPEKSQTVGKRLLSNFLLKT